MAPKRPCNFFQLGKCTRGDACGYPHVKDPNFKRKACQYFLKGKCSRGADCTFSHANEDIAFVRAATCAEANGTSSAATTEELFKRWRYSIPTGSDPARPLGPAMSQFCQQALELVGGETGLMQETVTRLACQGGLRRITELIGQDFGRLSDAQMRRIFDTQVLPFFKVITHKNVESSVVLAPRLMTIYNVLYDGNGERVTRLFEAITGHLQKLSLERPDGVDTTNVDAVDSSLAVLDKLIEINTEAQVQDGLKLVAETFTLLFEDLTSAAVIYDIKPAKRHLRRIEQRLGLGQGLPDTEAHPKRTGARAHFELARERPGGLSDDGPRHDNDDIDIRKISILPTLQEIQSSRNEYLPLADPRDWHIGGLEGLLDRHFRLLREDTVGQLRDASKFELERLQDPEAHAQNVRRQRQGARTHIYDNVAISDVAFDPVAGMEFAMSFDQPKSQDKKDERQRRDWWQNSKRLGYDALVCLISSAGSATFFVVSPERLSNRIDDNLATPLRKHYDLWSDDTRASVIAKPVTQRDAFTLLDQMLNGGVEQLSLVEFPGVVLPAFKPTLEAMKYMSDTLDVPFSDILCPVSTLTNPDRDIEVLPPEYATRPGFQFSLASITHEGAGFFLTPGEDVNAAAAELAVVSSLDAGQAQAVVSALSRSLALIQGPPGTGKSYTGAQLVKVLLDNKAAGQLGPIVVVCFTNHALDQSLERLLDGGIEQLVRIGGNSKSERLQDVNLREVAQRLDLTKTERTDRWELTKKVNEEAREINAILNQMSQLGTQNSVEVLLQMHYPDHHEQLFSQLDEDGFETVNYHPGSIIDDWLKAAPWGRGRPRSVDELTGKHVASMTGHERIILHQHWLEEMSSDLKHRLNVALSSYNDLKATLDNIKIELDLRVLRQANIIGITTSGLARHLNLLRRVDAKVLICEEAGEVLESHLLTALLPSIQHAILIGDHQQLRPKVQNYSLSTESANGEQYALDVSLFERLVRPLDTLAQPLPFSTLEVQRRMHPFISQLIRETLYPRLQDAPSVSHYPEVVGMKRRLFWMHHEHKENEGDDTANTSRTNNYEVDMVAALVKHLVRQGVYKPEDIAVLTPYLGQLRKIRQKLGSSFEIMLNDRDVDDLDKEGVVEDDPAVNEAAQRRTSVARGTLLQALRVATVDNFQGEESKVVIVSLVRSNAKNNPGFLRTANRINVLLSRAQHGMYIIGNANTTESVKMWTDVLDIFRQDGNFGTALELSCPRHPDTPLIVQRPDDFVRLSPEAGCDLACDKMLPCGHACVSKCHSTMLHNAVFCQKQCTRPKPGCSHNCPLPCGEVCHKQCIEIVKTANVTLACGHHLDSLPCYQYQDPKKITCDVPVEREVPGCLHTVIEPCHVDVSSDCYQCTKTCGTLLDCSHQCQRPCYKCRTSNKDDLTGKETKMLDHGNCRQACDRNYTTCRHRCRAPCHGAEPCPLCEAKCEVSCSHAVCDKRCSEPCAPCAEPLCNSHCPHSQCNMPCSAPCDNLPCSLRCTEELACGCQCPGVCGEACPDVTFCQTHASDEVKAMHADMIMFDAYESIDLDEDPCIFTSCGHVLTLSTLDGLMDMAKHYEVDGKTGAFTALKTSSEPFSSDELKLCPTCRGPLRSIARYGRIVRRALLDESVKKLTAWANSMHHELAGRLENAQEQLLIDLETVKKPKQEIVLNGGAKDQLKVVKKLTTAKRYRRIMDIRNRIQTFADKLRGDEQPYQRVHDLVETARRRKLDSGIPTFELSGSAELQLRETLLAASLLLRADIVILTDVIQIHEKTSAGVRKGTLTVDFRSNRNVCNDMALEAKPTKNPRQEAEGHLFWARFAAMECGTSHQADKDALKTAAKSRLQDAEEICNRFSDEEGATNPTRGLAEEIAEVRKMLDEGLSSSEMRMIVQVMAREFMSTGHWYTCANGHPFTVGECGMPMQESRCPTCGAGIGGRSHRPAEGVVRADFEERFGDMHI